jgi:microcystin-dependent protein
MAQPFVATIQIFPFNFAPKGWAFCAGQILPLSQNTALFSLLGTTYGGDGKSNFALPNLNGLTPLGAGQGPGLSLYDLGEQTGSQTVSLLQSEIPSHGHSFSATANAGTVVVSSNNQLAVAHNGSKTVFNDCNYLTPAGTTNTVMSPLCTSVYGSGQPHDNMQPYLGLNFCIALQGVFPPRG